MSIQALREQRNDLSKQANHLLAEKGDQIWSGEDQAKFDGFTNQIELLDKQIAANEKMLKDQAEEHFTDVEHNAPTKKNDIQKGHDLFLRKLTSDLSADEAALVRNAMSTTTGSEGGFTVDPTISSQLIEALKDFGGMRRVAGNITTANGADSTYPTTDGTTEEGEVVAQNATASSADVSFGTVGLNTHKFGSKVITVPIELLQDTTVDLEGLINRRMRDRIGRIQNRMFTVGTGTNQPNGAVTASAVGKVGANGQTVIVTYDDLVDLIESLDQAYLEGDRMPSFMFSQGVRKVVRKLKDTAGRPIWTPSYDAGIRESVPDNLLGYNVEINNHMPTPAANAKSIGFGDFSQYMVRDAMQVTLFKFEDSAFLTKGQVGFMAWARAGGNLLDTNAVKLYQHSAS